MQPKTQVSSEDGSVAIIKVEHKCQKVGKRKREPKQSNRNRLKWKKRGCRKENEQLEASTRWNDTIMSTSTKEWKIAHQKVEQVEAIEVDKATNKKRKKIVDKAELTSKQDNK